MKRPKIIQFDPDIVEMIDEASELLGVTAGWIRQAGSSSLLAKADTHLSSIH
ncbi:MAG TPA: hypothetical protein VFA74_16125 [Terriglobales bacterium]|nr:hypothetical protein [Terriglobales bacterium]